MRTILKVKLTNWHYRYYNIAVHNSKLGTTLPYEEVQPHNYTSMDSKIVLEQLDEGEQSDQKELSTEISTRQSHGRQQSDEDTVSTEQLVKRCEAIKGN